MIVFGYSFFYGEGEFVSWQEENKDKKVLDIIPLKPRDRHHESVVFVKYSYNYTNKSNTAVKILENPVLVWVRKLFMPASWQVLWEKVKPIVVSLARK